MRKLAAFAAVLAAILGGGATAGALLDPDAPGGKADAKAQARERDVRSSGMNGMAGGPRSAQDGTDVHVP